jgi:hypothetical protein
MNEQMLMALAQRARREGNYDAAVETFKRIVEMSPGTEIGMKALYEIDDIGRLLSTVRGQDAKKKAEAVAPTYFKKIEKQKQKPQDSYRVKEGDEKMINGDYLEAYQHYQSIATDPKASQETRDMASRMSVEAINQLNKTPG